MEISNLLGKIKGGEKDSPPSFLALEITDEIVQAAVWQVVNGHTEVLAIGIPVEWDGKKGDAKELVSSTDATIASAVEGISQELNEVVFGLNSSWLEQEDISPTKRQLLKAISHDLELKPLGFVIVTDSLLHYLKMQEGTPTTAIMIQVALDSLTVMLLRFGKIESSVDLGRSDDIVVDLEEGLSRFPTDTNLPSRIIVFNSMHNLDELVQNLLSHDWQNKFKFLHVPKIETLPKDVLIKSIAVAGGSEVAKSIGFTIDEEIAPHKEELGSSEELIPAEEFGFTPSKKLPPSPSPFPSTITSEPDSAPAPPPPPPPAPKPKSPRKRFRLSFPKLSFPKRSPVFSIIGLAFLAVITILFSVIWLIPKAKVVILVEPKILDENTSLTLSSTATSLDLDNSIVPANLITKTIKGEETLSTTGKETVGEKATGEVTIYNRTSLSKTFSAGTVLVANSLNFTLLEDVTVASSSSTVDSELKTITTPGKSTVELAAKNIGEAGNLPENTEFTIGNFSKDTYLAKNNSALTGGSSKEIQVVDKKDQDDLLTSLTAKLIDQASQEIISEIGEGKSIYLFRKGLDITTQSFSAKIGGEADVLTLTLELEAKGLSYDINDVEQLVASTLTRAIPPEYERTQDLPIVELGDVIVEESDQVEAEAKITVSLLPVLDISTIQAALKGRASSEVEETLSSLITLQSAEIEITPLWLPPRYKHMPRNPKNIFVTIRSTNQ
ncbi:MAG: hypothetical protein ABII80_00895 [bacterium]